MINNKNWETHEKILTTEKSDWQKRVETLKLLKNAISLDDKTGFEFTSKNSKGIALQLNDLRSAIVKLASELVELFSEKVINFENLINYEKFCDHLLREENLHKALGSANKVINKHATKAVVSLFEFNLVSFQSLEHFTKMCKRNKISRTRERVAEFIFIFMENIINGSNNRKIKLGDLSFFKKSTDLFIRDANESVRSWAKKTKAILDDFQDAISNYGDTSDIKEKSFERRTTKEKDKKDKKIKHHSKKKEEPKYTPPKNYNKNIKSLNLSKKKNNEKKAKSDLIKGFKRNQNHHEKKNHNEKKIHYEKKKPENILEILEDPSLSILEQINFLRRFDLNKFCRNCNFNEFKNLLTIHQFVRNNELSGIIEEIFSNIKIDNFFSDLLSFLDREGRNYEKIPDGLWENLHSMDFIYFLEFFIKENSFGGLELVNNKFDLDEFEYIISKNENLADSLLNLIDLNLTKKSKNRNKKFLIMNVKLLELIFQSTFMVKNFRKYSFNPNFLKELNSFNSTLAKFFNYRSEEKKREKQYKVKERQKQQPKENNHYSNEMEIEKEEEPKLSKQKLSKKKQEEKKKYSKKKQEEEYEIKKNKNQQQHKNISKNQEKAPNFAENKKIVELLTQANLTTKKSVLKSIIDHLQQMQNSKGEIEKNQESETVFYKTIDILKCTGEGEQIDQEIITTSFKLIELMNLFCIKNHNLYKLLLNSIIYFLRNDLVSRDFFCEKIIKSSLRQKILNFMISDLIILEDPKEIVFIIKILIVFLKIGKNFEDKIFHDDVLEILNNIISIMKKLFIHSQVSIRKNVVHFFVQSFYFFTNEEFENMMNQFSPEQRKLIEIYIKKSQR